MFKVDDINLDRMNTIKVFGESGTLMGLLFFVPIKGRVLVIFGRGKGRRWAIFTLGL